MNSEVKNTSGIHPKGNKVLVLPQVIESYSKGGIFIPVPSQEKEEMAQMFGKVIEIGRMCWVDEPEPRAAVGDDIIFARYAGELFTGDDGKKYRIMNARDVIAGKDPKVGVTDVVMSKGESHE